MSDKGSFTIAIKKNIFGKTYISCIFADKDYIEYSAEKTSDGKWKILKNDDTCCCKGKAYIYLTHGWWVETPNFLNMTQAYKFLKKNANHLL